MALLLTTFKYHGKLQSVATHADNDAVLAEVITKLKQETAELTGYEPTHDHEIDNHCDSIETYLAAETIFEIRLDVDLETVNLHDDSNNLHQYVLNALELTNSTLSYYQCGQEPATKTVIAVDVNFAEF